jgi:hypothetical protein
MVNATDLGILSSRWQKTLRQGFNVWAMSSTEIDVSWDDQAKNELGWRVERSEDGITFNPLDTLEADQKEYQDISVEPGKKYWYRVCPFDTIGDGTFTVKASATAMLPALGAVQLVPDASNPLHFGLQADAGGISDPDVHLVIEMSSNGNAFTLIGSFDLNDVPEVDLPEGSDVTIRASLQGDGVKSEEFSETEYSTPPAVPTGAAVSNVSSDRLTLSWDDNSSNETGYEVEIEGPDGAWSLYDTLPAGSGTMTMEVVGLDDGTLYNFAISAVKDSDSNGSAMTSATTKLAAPTGLRAYSPNPHEMNLYWTDNSKRETGYRIEYSTGGGSVTQLNLLIENLTGYPIRGLDQNTSYEFTITALGNSVNSDPENYTASTARIDPPAAPPGTPAKPQPGVDPGAPGGTGFTYKTIRTKVLTGTIVENCVLTQQGFDPPGGLSYQIDLWLDDSAIAYVPRGSLMTGSAMLNHAHGTITEYDGDTETRSWSYSKENPAFWTSARWYPLGVPFPSAAFGLLGTPMSWAITPNQTELQVDREVSIAFPYTDPADPPVEPPPPGDPDPDPEPLTAPSVVSIVASDAVGTENNAAPDKITFTVSRSGGDINQDLDVSLFAPAGTATSDDYSGAADVVVIPAGQASVAIDFIPVDDSLFEPTETVWAILQAGTNYVLDSSFSASASIIDNDGIDIDVDSDRNNGDGMPSRSPQEEQQEMGGIGKLLGTNDDDRDGDGIPDFADGFNAFPDQMEDNSPPTIVQGGKFIPVVIAVGPNVDLGVASFQLNYSMSNPAAVVNLRTGTGTDADPYVYGTPSGLLRLWTKSGESPRNMADIDAGGDFIGSRSGTATLAPWNWSRIGITPTHRATTIWVEAIGLSSNLGDATVTFNVDADGQNNGTQFTASDSVCFTNVDVDVMIGANSANDDSLHDDWVGADGHKIYNYLRMQGPAGVAQHLTAFQVTPRGGTVTLRPFTSGGAVDTHKGTVPSDLVTGGSAPFLIIGGNVSAKADDVRINAGFKGQIFGSESLSVLKFNPERENYGDSDTPVNPIAVSAGAVMWGGNVFGADVEYNLAYAHRTNRPELTPALDTSHKLHYGDIEVVWGRVQNSTSVKSTATGSPLVVNPSFNGTKPQVNDNLRVRDTGITGQMEANGAKITYVLGHPTESVITSLDIFANNAAKITAVPKSTITYPLGVSVMRLLAAGTNTVIGDLGITAADVTEIVSRINTLWSQVSIEFAMPGGAGSSLKLPKDTDDPTLWNATTGSVFETYDNLLTDVKSNGFIDLVFTHSLDSGTLSGYTQYPGMWNGASNDDRGSVVAATFGGGSRRTNAELARAAAHELIHYIIQRGDGSHSNLSWNLFADGNLVGFPWKRDLSEAQFDLMAKTKVVPTKVDF